MSNLNNILHGCRIPLSALVSLIFGMMILSFPLGTYVIFNSNIGDDIDHTFPLDSFDVFIAGLHLGIPLEVEIGDIFIVFWSIFLILFVIAFLGPKNNFLKSINQLLNKQKINSDANHLVNIIKWFSIIVVISAVINFIQESFGIMTVPPTSLNDLTLFLAVTISPITEEIGFRLMLIGIPLFGFGLNFSTSRAECTM